MTPLRPSRNSPDQAHRDARWRAALGGVFLAALLLRLAYAAHVELRYRVPFVERVAILFAGAALPPARRVPAGAPGVPSEPR